MLPPGPPEEGQQDRTRLDGRILRIAGVVILGVIMSILDTTIVTVAQTTFQRSFRASPAVTAWTMTGYTLALAAVIPLTGWAARRFGAKRLYLFSLVFFSVGSVLCATATSIELLIGFRVLQGLGGGMLMPLGTIILTSAAGSARMGRVMSVVGIPMLLGPIAGPILGGYLIKVADWPWIFGVNVPIALVTGVLAHFVLPGNRGRRGEPFDVIGFLTLAPGLALVLLGVSELSAAATPGSPAVLVPLVLGLVMVAGCIGHELRRSRPLLDLRLFGNRDLWASMLTFTVFAVASFGSAILYSQYFIAVRGASPLIAGLLFAGQGFGAMLTMPLAGVLADRIGARPLVLAGLALMVPAMAVFALLTPTMSLVVIETALFVQGLGLGLSMMPIMAAALRTLRPESISDGGTLTNIVQQVATSIGVAVFSVLVTVFARGAVGAADASAAYARSFLVALILLALCIPLAMLLPGREPARRTGRMDGSGASVNR